MKKVSILFGLLIFLSSCGSDAAVEFNTQHVSETGVDYYEVLWSDNIDLLKNEIGPCNSTEICYEVDKPITEVVLTTRMPEDESQRGQDANCHLYTGERAARVTSDQFNRQGTIINGLGLDIASMALRKKETVTLTFPSRDAAVFRGQSVSWTIFTIEDCNHVQVSVSTE